MKAAVSHDEGQTWSEVADTPTIKHAGAKIWGQKTSDGKYALAYNPHTNNKHRWPLAVITGDDGLGFDRMMCVIGDLPPIRYAGGPFKDPGYNYVRGIENGQAAGPDDAMYVAYSMNKEDIWLSRIQVPIVDRVTYDVHDDFTVMPEDTWIANWNIYSPLWAPVSVSEAADHSGKCLKLEDFDRNDYAKAERVFKEGKRIEANVLFMAAQQDHGELYIEMCDARGSIPLRVVLNSSGELKVVHGRKNQEFMNYEAARWYELKIQADTRSSSFDVLIDGRSLSESQQYQGQKTSMKGWFMTANVESLERITFRTGAVRQKPHIDDWENGQDLPNVSEKDTAAAYYIKRLDVISE